MITMSRKTELYSAAREIAREHSRIFNDSLREPSTMAKTIVASRKELSTREQLNSVAKDMGIPAGELATDILLERELVRYNNSVTHSSDTNSPVADMAKAIESAPETIPSQFEAGYTELELAERRAIVKARILAEHATRPDYRYARHMLETIGREKGAVISTFPDGQITIYAVKRAISPEYARAMAVKAGEKLMAVVSRVELAEKAIDDAPLKRGTPGQKRELAKAQDALVVARRNYATAAKRVIESAAITADGLRLEIAHSYSADSAMAEYGPTLFALSPVTIESWELPNAIIRRPFRETLRIKTRREPISPVECEVLQNEYDAEQAIIRERVAAIVEAELQAKRNAETLEAENKRSERNAIRRAYKTEHQRNSRKRNNRKA